MLRQIIRAEVEGCACCVGALALLYGTVEDVAELEGIGSESSAPTSLLFFFLAMVRDAQIYACPMPVWFALRRCARNPRLGLNLRQAKAPSFI